MLTVRPEAQNGRRVKRAGKVEEAPVFRNLLGLYDGACDYGQVTVNENSMVSVLVGFERSTPRPSPVMV